MLGDELRAVREARSLNQAEFAAWLNDQLDRRYDKQRISRWESGSERIPQRIASLLSGTVDRTQPTGPALVVAIANQKGGVGKTVTAVNVAAILAQKSYAVLLIDADPQANATMHLGVNPYEQAEGGKPRATLYNVLKSESATDLHEITIATGDHGLQLAPASIRLAEIEPEMMVATGGEHTLAERLAACRELYDFIVIDTPPNIGQITKNALTAADAVLIPCQTAVFSVVGIDFLLRNVTLTKRRSNPKLSILGILPTKFNRRLTNDVATLEEIRQNYGGNIRVFDPIPAAAIYDKTTAAGVAAVDIDLNTPGIAVFEDVAAAMIVERKKRVEANDAA